MKKLIVLSLILAGCSKHEVNKQTHDDTGKTYTLDQIIPRFKVGDCFKLDFSTEFNKVVMLHKVLKVGKTEYLTRNGYTNDGVRFEGRPFETGINIPGADREGIQISCSKLK